MGPQGAMRFPGKQVYVNTIIKWADICCKAVNCCYGNNLQSSALFIYEQVSFTFVEEWPSTRK